MAKPMSWKWKLAIGSVVFILFAMGFVFTEAGHIWMKARIMNAYNELPESERRASPLADKFMSLAYFRGNVTLDSERAIEMYKEFCGYKFRGPSGDEYMFKAIQTGKLEGICSPDGKTGWGPMHIRAPEAFYEYIQLYSPTHSSQFTKSEICNYYRLFFTWCRTRGDHKVHPNFMKYWPKLRDLAMQDKHPWPADVPPNVPGAPVYKAENDPSAAQ